MEYGILGEDIVAEILSRLPKKSFHRFKCVSKGWLNLLCSLRRISPQTTQTGLLCRGRRPPIGFRPRISGFGGRPSVSFLRFVNDNHREVTAMLVVNSLGFSLERDHSVIDSCNGLLLIGKGSGSHGPRRTGLPTEYDVYNPATKQTTQLPSPPTPFKPPLGIGFSVDGHRPHHYKVIRFFHISCDELLVFEIFSSQTGQWRVKQFRISDPSNVYFPARQPLHSNQSLFLNGAAHWIMEHHLLIYHLKDECFKLIRLPKCHDFGACCLWVSEGRLHYCRGSTDGFMTWVPSMEDGDCSKQDFEWRQKHNVILPRPILAPKSIFKPRAFNDDCEIVYFLYGIKVLAYKLETGELKVVLIKTLEDSYGKITNSVKPSSSSDLFGEEVTSNIYPFSFSLVDSIPPAQQ